MIEKVVSVYQRGEQGVFMHPSAFTDMGVLLAVPPFVQIRPHEYNDELWRALLELLNQSGYRIPHPKKFNQLAPLYEMAGCRSWKEFARECSYCGIEVAAGRLHITPGHWDGEGFDSSETDTRLTALDDPEAPRILTECLGLAR